jgi:mono/diheme cytochrome c family protein/glucose/arabinose dehydrogenase
MESRSLGLSTILLAGSLRLLGVLLLGSVTVPAFAVAADEDDDETHPGLVARYMVGERDITRVDRDVQFVWNASSPDARLPVGLFRAHWSGTLLIRTEGQHAFHLYLQGEAEVTLNGKTIVAGRRETPGWVAGELATADFGEQKMEIVFRKTSRQAVMRLFWSSEGFPVEPIPPQLLSHEAALPEIALIEHGNELFNAYRCGACHIREADPPAEPAPALANAVTALDRDWLVNWLVEPRQQTAHARMPAFGFSRDEARAVADFLMQQSAAAPLEKLPEGPSDESVIRRGEVVFRSVGCLACHTRGSEGIALSQHGGDLTHVGRKRTTAWIYGWLKDPASLNSDHRMPVFKLASDERRDLAVYLATSPPDDKAAPQDQPPATPKSVDDGKILVATARCAACHRITGMTVDRQGLPTLEKPVADWTKSCTQAGGDSRHLRPAYQFNDAQRSAIRAFIESRFGPAAPESSFARGQRLLAKKGCLACHERDGGQGIAKIAGAVARLDPDLQGQSEALVPPGLSAVGDKLQDGPLAEAIAGKQKTARLPWLRVRMPRFEHRPEEAEALLAYLVGHDRIPDGAPRIGPPVVPASAASDNAVPHAELSRAGQVLAGTRGFSCTACHKIAGYEPRNVALATRGSDLYLIGARMRQEFFTRWTRSPLRIIPGMEMPSFERPIAGILDGKIDRQLVALWEGLNDKSAPPKIDTSTIEQVLTVAPGESPKIIRDVFNIGDPLDPKFVPRALAIGFDHGINVLFDLDALAWRRCWSGDFARQRSSGKSWFWEPMAQNGFATVCDSPDVVLRKEGDHPDAVIAARKESGRSGQLLRYAHTDLPRDFDDGLTRKGAVRIEYTLTFELPEGATTVHVEESLFPVVPGNQRNQALCQRFVSVRSVPTGYDVALRSPPGTQETPPFQSFHKQPERRTATWGVNYAVQSVERSTAVSSAPQSAARQNEPISCVPGYDGVRLPLPRSIMPTAITWLADGTLAFCSLKGQVFLAKDTDGDGVEDQLTLFEEGLAAPYGLIADDHDLIVAHKPELLRLRDTDKDGRADVREVVTDGWGYTEDYHDWTTGIVRDSQGNLYIGTGSDYAKPGREPERAKWRGKVLRVDKQGHVTPLGHGFRYPTGMAITPDDEVFVSDNQGVQNTFNEINHLVEGASYGVPSLHEENPDAPVTLPAIQVPHPWTRSVNGIFFLPRDSHTGPFAGHGIGCEYDSRFLVRFTLERVGQTFQGAVYPFSRPTAPAARESFLGTLCGAVSPQGDIYIGSIHDSGWLGGLNVGDIVRLRQNGAVPVGIREIRASAGRFTIAFTAPIEKAAAARRENYEISGYTRKWLGSYSTPDSGRHKLEIESVAVSADGRSVVLHTPRQQEGHVYEITCGKIGPEGSSLWPSVGHYTLNKIP